MTTTHTETDRHQFSTDPSGLPTRPCAILVQLGDGDTYDLRLAPVAKRVG